MTRCTAQVDVALHAAAWWPEVVETIKTDDWMCRTLSRPCPTAPAHTTLLDLHDALVECEHATAFTDFDAIDKWLTTAREWVDGWFRTTCAGHARLELEPEDLWALFQLVHRVQQIVDLSRRSDLPVFADQDTDICWTDFDEPAALAGR